ncbi:MAG: nucleotidyltransferase domain-containing protein [Candidatus Micrarchaeota archaeon]
MKRDKVIELLRKTIKQNGIKKAYLFGSFARKESKYNDIDIIIEPPKGFSLLDLSRVANSLEDQLGKNIDIVTLKGMDARIKKMVKNEMVAI